MDRHDVIDTLLIIDNYQQNNRLDELEAGLEETKRWQTYEVRRVPPQRIIIEIIQEQYQDWESGRSLQSAITWGCLVLSVASVAVGILHPMGFFVAVLLGLFAAYGWFELRRTRFKPAATYCLTMARTKLETMLDAGELDESASRELNRELAFLLAHDPVKNTTPIEPNNPEPPKNLPPGAKVWK